MICTNWGFSFKAYAFPKFCTKTPTQFRSGRLSCSSMKSASRSPAREARISDTADELTLEEWQGWGALSPIPAMVKQIIEDLKGLEHNIDSPMSFGGLGGKLKGDFRVVEDKKHRARYQAIDDSEEKFHFYSARQIACRLLGSKGYLCQKCWLPMEDCMCSKLKPCTLWPGIRFWVYMHPKDFLRQNNTGKLLWQVFGVQAATLCLYGIAEDEAIMWNAFKLAGKNRVFCLYPNQTLVKNSFQDTLGHESSENLGSEPVTEDMHGDKTLNFILIDGTWSNSSAMFKRLKERAMSAWGEEDIPCISLVMSASPMHKLRPQPAWDRTCTAAAAIGLLSELHLLPAFSPFGLNKQGELVEDALITLLEALTTRRLRKGRSITRKARQGSHLC